MPFQISSCCLPLNVPSPRPSLSQAPAPQASLWRVRPNAPMQLSLLAKARRRRKIRAKLEEVARIVSSPALDHEDGLALFSEPDVALLTDTGEIILSKTTSARPFEAIAPKIRSIRASAAALSAALDQPMDVVHVRGQAGMLHAYVVGAHTLVAVTEVSPGSRNLDAVVARVDQCLGLGGEGYTCIQQLETMMHEF